MLIVIILFVGNYESLLNNGYRTSIYKLQQSKRKCDTERMIRTMKVEFFWLRDWSGEAELGKELNKWVEYYDRNYLHSAHGYRTPIQAEERYYKIHDSHVNAA